MKLSTGWKWLLGLGTGVYALLMVLLVPMVVAISLFVGFITEAGTYGPMAGSDADTVALVVMLPVWMLGMCVSLMQPVLAGVYTVLLVKDQTLGDWEKIFYLLGCYFVPWISMPLYFGLKVLPAKA